MSDMLLDLSTPTPDRLDGLLADVSCWQQDGLPVQLHPGDLGWQWRFGAATLAAGLRVWTAGSTTVAVGLADTNVIRLAVAPAVDHDDDVARAIVRDLEAPDGRVLSTDELAVEARFGTALRSRLQSEPWVAGEAWTPLVRDLSGPVATSGLRVKALGPDDNARVTRVPVVARITDRVAVQRAAFPTSTFTAEAWHAMAGSPAYGHARCLVGYDDGDVPVAAVTVWSAGPGRPGLLEPMGVHREHRGHGHGRAITLAAAAALRQLGASSAAVATPSATVGGVATYVAAGFLRGPDVSDVVLRR